MSIPTIPNYRDAKEEEICCEVCQYSYFVKAASRYEPFHYNPLKCKLREIYTTACDYEVEKGKTCDFAIQKKVRTSFLLKYPNHYSKIQCKNTKCFIQSIKEYFSKESAEKDGWKFITNPEMFLSYWLCPIFSSKQKENKK
jgi:hypothetical protein